MTEQEVGRLHQACAGYGVSELTVRPNDLNERRLIRSHESLDRAEAIEGRERSKQFKLRSHHFLLAGFSGILVAFF
jgi:hypothetical protein